MWQRFSERARKVVVDAQAEACSVGAREVTTEHLFLALLRQPDSIAREVLSRLEVDAETVRAKVVSYLKEDQPDLVRRIVNRWPQAQPRGPTEGLKLSSRAKAIIRLAEQESPKLGNRYIGTEHILLALIADSGGVSGRILSNLGVDLIRARAVAIEVQNEHITGQRADPWSKFEETAVMILRRAGSEAMRLASSRVEPTHILMAALIESPPWITRSLEALGCDAEDLCSRLATAIPTRRLGPDEELDWSWSAHRAVDRAKIAALADRVTAVNLLLAAWDEIATGEFGAVLQGWPATDIHAALIPDCNGHVPPEDLHSPRMN
jgi:ATP-dependent Clp protease ATP-binding subunit ClpA